MAGWNDINNITNSKRQDSNNSNPQKRVTGVDDEERTTQKSEPEVRLLSTEWKPGESGFRYEKDCTLEVNTEYIKETIRSKITGYLWGKYGEEEVNLSEELTGHIDNETDTVKLQIKKLHFVNSKHYEDWDKDKNVKAEYFVKRIFHSPQESEKFFLQNTPLLHFYLYPSHHNVYYLQNEVS